MCACVCVCAHFVLLPFWRHRLEPLIDLVSDSNLGSFFYETVTTSRPPLTTPRSLLTPASSIAPRLKNYSGSLRLCRHLKALNGHAFGLPLSARRCCCTPTAAEDGRPAYKEWTPPHPFARHFACPSQLGCERPSCQGAPQQYITNLLP